MGIETAEGNWAYKMGVSASSIMMGWIGICTCTALASMVAVDQLYTLRDKIYNQSVSVVLFVCICVCVGLPSVL